MNTEAAISDYAKVLKKQKVLKDTYVAESSKLEHIKKKIEAYLSEVTEPVKDVPEIVKEQSPYFAWKVMTKTDETLIAAHMQIDDVLLVELQKEVDAKIKALKEQKEALESYALAVMNERGCSNFGLQVLEGLKTGLIRGTILLIRSCSLTGRLRSIVSLN